MWVSLIQLVEGLKRKDSFPEEEILTPDYNMEILPEFLACLFNLYAEYIMRNAGWKHKLESRFPGEISITSDRQMISPLWQRVKN